MVELDAGLIDKAQKSIAKSLERVGKKQFKDEEAKIKEFVAESMGRISGSTDLLSVVKDTDIVIEAIVENLEVKQKLFASIDGVRMSNSSWKNFFFLSHKIFSGCKAIGNFCQ
jgi:3-hydroxyacyl-CoA dehydrogenase